MQKVPNYRSPKIYGMNEHIVMLASGKTPKLLFATEDLASSSNLQTLIGMIYASMDPSSGTRDPRNRAYRWWKGGRKNFQKYQAFKYTSKVARTPDGKDYFTIFSVYEKRSKEGDFELVGCPGSEKKNSISQRNKARSACITEFLKNVNPLRSKKDVKGFMIYDTNFLFSKHDETRDMQDLNKKQFPAMATLGRWLLKTIPDEFEAVGLKEKNPASLAQSALPMSLSDQEVPIEGLYGTPATKFVYSAYANQGDKKMLNVVKKPAHALGLVEADLNDQDFWSNPLTEANFAEKHQKTAGLIFAENDGMLVPLAQNHADLQLDSRDALIAMGAALADPASMENRNLFDKCLDQSAFNGKWDILFEDADSGDVKREECDFCQSLYDKAKAETKAKNPNANEKSITKAFVQSFEQSMKDNKSYKHGASLFNQKNELLVAAQGIEDKEVYFALAKYGQAYCKQLQQLATPKEAGLRGDYRLAG
jgi:hypothetical protein